MRGEREEEVAFFFPSSSHTSLFFLTAYDNPHASFFCSPPPLEKPLSTMSRLAVVIALCEPCVFFLSVKRRRERKERRRRKEEEALRFSVPLRKRSQRPPTFFFPSSDENAHRPLFSFNTAQRAFLRAL